MLNCPFCGYDYTEEGPREGRCPGCGGVLAWNGAIVDQQESAYADGSTIEAGDPDSPPLAQTSPDLTQLDADRTPESQRARTAPTVSVPPDEPEPAHEQPAAAPQPPEVPDAEPAQDELSPASKTDRSHMAQKETLDISAAAAIRPRELSGTDRRHVTAVWAKSLEGIESPRMTIEAGVTDQRTTSDLVIRPRTVRRPQDSRSTPADYELLEIIGEGGVGVVYAARQSSIDRTVAVKMLKPETVTSQEKEKFLFEAMITGDLDHPNIVPIHDLGSNKMGDLFYSMKRVKGTPWSDVIDKKSLAENLEILMKVCDAIAFAHARNVVHRDIKPENVMLGDFGEVLMMDWGISLSTSLTVRGGAAVTSSSMGGTPAYMAPEMATGPIEKICAASDVYLLGAVLFEIVTGQTPHTGPTVMDCLLAAARNDIQRVPESGELLDIALRAMASRMGDRYASVQELQAAIRQYQEHSESIALATRAEEDLKRAVETNDPEDFARAVFGFDEAYSLWRGNRTARDGLSQAKLAYAQSAYQKDDFRLGLSVLDDDDPQHAELRRKLEAGLRERASRRRRLRNVKLLAGLLALIMVGGATIAFFVILDAWRTAEIAKVDAKEEEKKAISAANTAIEARKQAEDAKDQAQKNRKRAEKEEKRAVAREQEAQHARQDAEKERHEALLARRREQQASYFSEIRLIQREIANNDFGNAVRRLNKQNDPARRPMRRWEWGHLSYLSHLDTSTLEVFDPETDDAESLEAMALSTDGRWLAAGSSNGKVYLWAHEGESWQQAGPTRNVVHGSPVYAVAFSHDGRLLATGGGTDEDGQVKIWDLQDLDQGAIQILDGEYGHERHVTSVEFSHDDKILLTASADESALLWPSSPEAGNDSVRRWRDRPIDLPPKKLSGHYAAVRDAHFSHEGEQLWVVTASDDGTVRVWDRERGREVARCDQHKGAVFSAAFSPDDAYVASGSDAGDILLWPVKLAELVQRAKEAANNGDQVFPDEVFRAEFVQMVEKRLDKDSQDPAGDPSFPQHRGHQDSVLFVDFSPDGSRLVSGSSDNTVKLWDVAELVSRDPSAAEEVESRITLRGHGGGVTSAVFTAGGTQLLSAGRDMTVKRWTPEEYRETRTFQASQTDAGTGPDTSTDPDASEDSDAVTDADLLSAAISPDERWVAAAFADGRALVWHRDRETSPKVLEEGHMFLTSRALFSPDGKQLFTTALDGTVRQWDVATGTQRRPSFKETGNRNLLALSRNGKWLITGGMVADDLETDGASTGEQAEKETATEYERQATRLWNLETGEFRWLDHGGSRLQQLVLASPLIERETLRRQIRETTVARLSTDGTLAFTGDEQGGCRLWDTRSGSLKAHWQGHYRAVNAAAFTADDRVLVTAGSDHTVVCWDPATGRQIANRVWRDGNVELLDVFSPATSDTTTGNGDTLILTAVVPRRSQARPDAADANVAAKICLWKPGDEGDRFVNVDQKLRSIAFAGDGRGAHFVTDDGANCHRWHWDFGSGSDTPQLVSKGSAGEGSVSMSTFVPGSEFRQILTVGGNGADLWHASGRRRTSFRPHGKVTSVQFSPDSRYVVTSGSDGSAKIWEFRDEVRAVCRLDGGPDDDDLRGHRDAVNGAEFDPRAGRMRVVTCSRDGTAKIWQRDDAAGTWHVVRTLGVEDNPGKPVPVKVARFSPRGKHIVTLGEDGRAQIWDADDDSREPVKSFACHDEPILCGAFSPDGQWIATGGRDNTVALFDWAGERELARIALSTTPLSLAFSPDRHRLLTGEEGRIVRLWDLQPVLAAGRGETTAASPKEVLTLDVHQSRVMSVSFSNSGRDVLTAARDGKIILWLGRHIEPSVALSPLEVVYQEPNAPVVVAPQAAVSVPSPQLLAGARLTVRMVGDGDSLPTGREWLDVDPEAADKRDRIRIDEDGSLWFQHDGDDVPFADYAGRVSGSEAMQIELNGNASVDAVTHLVRSVTYRNEEPPGSKHTRNIEFYFSTDLQEPPQDDQAPAKTVRFDPPVSPADTGDATN